MAAALVAGALAATGGTAQAAPQLDDLTQGTQDKTALVGGGIEIAPAFNDTFNQVPTSWLTAWPGATQPTTANGTLDLNQALMNSGVVTGAGSSISFRATFAQINQHVGYASGFENNIWAIFSRKFGTDDVSARTQNGAAPPEETLLPNLVGTPHDYRIDRTAAGFTYYVDGALVATDADTITTPVYAQASDITLDTPLTIESMALRNVSQGTFTSRVFDAGDPRVTGISFTPDAETLNGTSISHETQTSSDNATWSAWGPVGAAPPARYFRYRANLSTPNAAFTPRLKKATVDFTIANTTPGGGSAPPTGDTKKPKVGMPRDADVNKRGKAKILLACPDDELFCKATLKFVSGRKTIASKSGKISGGDSRYITLKLSKAAKKQLAKARKMKVTATLTVTDAAGNKRTSSKKIWLYSL